MSAGTGIRCAFCSRPVLSAMWFGGQPYHLECTQSPHREVPFVPTNSFTVPLLTEADIRRIVREELAKDRS